MPKALAYTVDEAAAMLRCSAWSVRQAVRRGDLPVVPLAGRRVLIPAAALERAVDDQATFLGPCSQCGRPCTGGTCSECDHRTAS